MTQDDYAHESVEVWPENLQATQMIQRVGSRWVYGSAGGVTGIRWEAVYPLMDRLGLDPVAWDDLLADMEVMEIAALKEINKS